MTKKSKKEFLDELNNPHLINTYKKIIDQLKESLHKFIDDPNSSTEEKVLLNLGCFPFLQGTYCNYYKVYEDRLVEVKEKVNVLGELFMEHYTTFVYRALESDKRVLETVEDGYVK